MRNLLTWASVTTVPPPYEKGLNGGTIDANGTGILVVVRREI
jgi:hypothetical protein